MKHDSIYSHDDYRKYFSWWLTRESQTKRRGGMSRVATHLNVNTSFLSQVVHGTKELSQEQALKLSEIMGLEWHERDYFINLVLEAKAGTHALKKYYRQKSESIRRDGEKVSSNVGTYYVLTDKELTRFYADPIYSQIRVMLSLPRYDSAQKIAHGLNLPLTKVQSVIDFLLDTGLCKHTADGKLTVGVARTHLADDSPLISSHHRNWRNKVMEFYNRMDHKDLAFTAPLTISKADFLALRKDILDLIKKISLVVNDSIDEEFAILNIDWIRLHDNET